MSVSICWLVVGAVYFLVLRRRVVSAGGALNQSKIRTAISPGYAIDEKLWLSAIASIAAVTLLIAILSPVNGADANAYHMPRIMRWIQDGSLAYYPSHVTRQLWIAPGQEYFLANLILLTGTDGIANLVEWVTYLACAVVVSLIARELGASRRGQIFAAFFAATMPMAIAEASSAEVDGFAAFWLVCAVALMLRVRRTGARDTSIVTAVALGAACGIASVTKATNGLYLIPFALWTIAGVARKNRVRLVALGLIAIVAAAAANAGPMSRNIEFYGRPLGPKRGGHTINNRFGPKVLASNVVRNASLHFTSYSPQLNRLHYRVMAKFHWVIGAGIDDWRTTYVRKFSVLPKREDEGVAGEPVHIVLLAVIFVALFAKRRKDPALAVLACALIGFLIYCDYLKWQPWNARMHLPLLVVSAGAAAVIVERTSRRTVMWIGVVLFVTALPAMFRESLRPIIARHNVLNTPREARLFIDSHHAHDAYAGATDYLASRGCSTIGLIETEETAEYPFWKMMQARSRTPVEIRHYGVLNDTRMAGAAMQKHFKPCAIVSIFYGISNLLIPPPIGFVRVWRQRKVTVYMRG